MIIKRNLMRETESLLIAAQDNAIKTNNIEAKIDKTQQNNSRWLCRDGDETINHIISEWGKLSQKEDETRLNVLGDSLEIVQEIKFDHTNKWYMHNSETCRMRCTNLTGILSYKRIT